MIPGIDSIKWGNADLYWMLLLPLALVPFWFAYERFRMKVEATVPARSLLKLMTEHVSTGRRIATVVCVAIALEFLAISAMRPKYGLKEITVRGIGVDTVIVLDASRSMKAADVAPDRLTASIVEISRLLDKIPGNRVALVPFAGIAFIQSPLTLDHEVIREYLRDLRITDIPVPGTAIGRALSVARQALGTSSGSANRAIILFTDGENFEGDPLKVADELSKASIRVFTVGVGTPAGQPIPILDDKGAVIGTAREKDGVTPILSKLNEEMLNDIAKRTGGKYFALTGSADVASELASEMANLEKMEYQVQVERLLEDRFQYPLACGILFMILPFLWLGGGGLRKTMVISLMLLSSQVSAKSIFEKDHAKVEEALELLRQGQAGDAAKALAELSDELGGRPDYLYNLAIARDKAGQFDEALAAVDQAISALKAAREPHPDWPSLGRLLHAKGTILMHFARADADAKKDAREVRQKWRSAVDVLAQALLLEPESEDTRLNLELAAMAAYPPCAKLDDQYEPDNTLEEAKFITPDPNTGEARQEMVLCPDDTDNVRVPLRASETMFAAVLEPGQEKQPARVELSLLDTNGERMDGPAKSIMHKAGDAKTVYLQVTGPKDEDGIPYVLDVRFVPPCPAGDDQMEPNDSRDTAKPISDGEHALRICPGNEDWFIYTEKQGTRKQIILSVPPGEGPLAIEVYSTDGAPLDVRSSDGVQVVVLPKAEQDAPFTIRVGGAEGFYQLSIQDAKGGEKNEERQRAEAGSQTMRELLDAIDSNEENLEAKEAARKTPYRDYVPEKDW